MENKSDWNHPLLYASGSLPSFKLDSNLLNKSRKIESVTGGALRNDVTVWKAEAFLYVSLQYVLYAYSTRPLKEDLLTSFVQSMSTAVLTFDPCRAVCATSFGFSLRSGTVSSTSRAQFLSKSFSQE